MYKFVIKNIQGDIIYTSVSTRKTVSEAQISGNSFIRVRSLMGSQGRLPIGSYVDVV